MSGAFVYLSRCSGLSQLRPLNACHHCWGICVCLRAGEGRRTGEEEKGCKWEKDKKQKNVKICNLREKGKEWKQRNTQKECDVRKRRKRALAEKDSEKWDKDRETEKYSSRSPFFYPLCSLPFTSTVSFFCSFHVISSLSLLCFDFESFPVNPL